MDKAPTGSTEPQSPEVRRGLPVWAVVLLIAVIFGVAGFVLVSQIIGFQMLGGSSDSSSTTIDSAVTDQANPGSPEPTLSD